MQLKDMNDHDILLFLVGEVRYIKKCVTNHLQHHEKNSDRMWKLCFILVGIAVTAIVGLVIV